MTAKLGRVRSWLADHDADWLLLENPTTVRWLTGFTGSNAQILISNTEALFVTDARYAYMRDRLSTHFDVQADRKLVTLLDDVIPSGQRVAYEGEWVPARRARMRKQELDAVEWDDSGSDVAALRAVKDSDELRALREACAATVAMMEHLHKGLSPKKTERDLANEAAMFAIWHGDGPAFAPIVCAGVNTGNPHHDPTDALVGTDTLVTIDAGVVVDGMHADMTRTFPVGHPAQELVAMHAIVDEVAADARDRLRTGTVGKDHDAAAREAMAEAGHAEHFTTGLGHGVGFAVHEAPMLVRASTDTVAADMTVTVEPGIYIAGVGGVRIEDTLRVTDAEPEVLTEMPRALDDLR